MLKKICQFTFNGIMCVEYLCEEIGDELPLHSHTFNHLTKVTKGSVEAFTGDGVVIRSEVGEEPIEYTAGRKHGIRGLTPGAMFMNISPIAPATETLWEGNPPE
jgi:hypothetical protein